MRDFGILNGHNGKQSMQKLFIKKKQQLWDKQSDLDKSHLRIPSNKKEFTLKFSGALKKLK